MLKRYRRSLARTFFLLDLLIVLCGFLAAACVRFGAEGRYLLLFPLQFKVFLVTYVVAWIFLAGRWHLYASKRLTSFGREALDVSKVTFLCAAFAAIPAFFFREMPISRLFLLYVWSLQTGGLIFFRFLLRSFLKYVRRQGYNFRHILVVGRNSRAAIFLNGLPERPELGLETVGILDIPTKRHIDPLFSKYPFLGAIGELENVLRTHVVDEVFVFLPIKSFYEDIGAILRLCESAGVEVRLPTNFFSLKLAKSAVSMYGDMPVIDLYTSPKMGFQLVLKRFIDIAASLVLLLAFSPFFALAAVLIKVTSPGPVFFRQPRLGYNGRLFDCLKFRTMVENAEELKETLSHLNEVSGPVFKIKNDPRVTKVGRTLRKTSMDELPQLINVLKGEMSLVGPRPPVPSEVKQYDLSQLRRLSVKPGITCLWQVNGRSSVAFEKWMELDREYIDHWSLWLDFKILAKTIPAVLSGSGAA